MRFNLGVILDAVKAVTGMGAGAVRGAPGGSGLAVLNEVIAAAAGEPVAGEAPLPAPVHRLGGLSERYESGGRGPGTVSSGRRDPGGVSYGLYQLATKTGTVATFVTSEGARWAWDFAGKEPGTPAFTAAWQAIARRDPEQFGAAQHAFIERTHYRPAVAGVKARTGLDLDTRADAVRDACWSCAVQHGGAVKILSRAVIAADAALRREDAHYDRELVEAIYAVRSDYVRGLAGKAKPGERQTMLDLASKRYPAELAEALALCDGKRALA